MSKGTKTTRKEADVNTKVTLNLNYLRAAQLAASNDQTRAYLCGVFVKTDKEKTTYVGTNGHILVRVEDIRAQNDGGFEAIVPNGLIAKLGALQAPAKVRRRNAEIADTVTVERVGDKLNFSSPLGRDAALAELTGYVIGGEYPDYARVIPAEEKLVSVKGGEKGVSLCFNWGYLERLMRAWSICTYGTPHKMVATKVRYGGEVSPSLMEQDDGLAKFTGVVMPMRG